MSNKTQGLIKKDRRIVAAAFFVCTLLSILFAGCVANDDNAMPWAAPDPRDGSITLPGYLGQ